MLKREKIELLTKMKLIRIVEESIAEKYSENKIRCPTHLCTGQEAIAAAIGQLLKKNDYGIYHLCNKGNLSYYEFVNKIKAITGSKSKIIRAKDSDFPSDGFKPLKTAIKSNKLKKIRSWDKALLEYLKL